MGGHDNQVAALLFCRVDDRFERAVTDARNALIRDAGLARLGLDHRKISLPFFFQLRLQLCRRQVVGRWIRFLRMRKPRLSTRVKAGYLRARVLRKADAIVDTSQWRGADYEMQLKLRGPKGEDAPAMLVAVIRRPE